jgi:hypothetical protein
MPSLLFTVFGHRKSLKCRRLGCLPPEIALKCNVTLDVTTHSAAALIPRIRRGIANLSSCPRLVCIDARRTAETSRLNLHDLNFRALNLAILYAVRCGVRIQLSLASFRLSAWPALPTFWS